MTELISRQKISKRHSQEAKSLFAAAMVYRETSDLNKGRKKKAGIRDSAGFKEDLNRNLRNRFARRKRKHKSSNPAAGQPSVRRKGFAKKAGKLLTAVLTALKSIDTKLLIGSAAVLAAAAAAAFYLTGFIIDMKMFEEFSLHEDVEIADVLYESLPSDSYGQGSGEISGIEPVLLTSGEPIIYKVKSGDTLDEISRKNNIKVGTLISFNKITDVRRLQVGMELMIPEYDGIPYEVKAGDSLERIAKNHNISINSILDANDLESDVLQPGEVLFIPGAAMNEFDYKKAMGTLFIYPTSGRLSSGYGYRPDPFTGQRRFHNGIDLANGMGTRVAATMSGRVADVGDRPSGYGKYVIIKHANGYQSLYAHFSRIVVREGQYVSQGEKIGEMGNTGRSTGPHLHFSIYKNNVPVNPQNYLW